MVNLDPRTHSAFVEIASREDISVSWVVRRALETLLAHYEAANVRPALTSAANRIIRLKPDSEGHQ